MSSSLEDELKNYLPKDKTFEILHLQNTPVEVCPIVTIESQHDKYNDLSDVTIKVPHFFSLAYNKKFVFGMEIHVYIVLKKAGSTPKMEYDTADRLLFVSKADTNGYCDIKFSAKQITKGLIRYLFSIDPSHYLKKVIPLERKYPKSNSYKLITKETKLEDALSILSERINESSTTKKMRQQSTLVEPYYHSYKTPTNITTKLCLFTRPADQYLFAESSKNPLKHTLNGAGLLKWWLSIIDELLCELFTEGSVGKLRIPGEEPITVKRYLKTTRFENWMVGDIFGATANSLAIFSIPLFSDDPKSRFLHELVEENRVLTTNLTTFWMELQERQEFKLSETVSVIGISGHTSISNFLTVTDKDTIVTTSKKEYKYIKNYITGEEYNSVEGALESYENVTKYLAYKFNMKLLSVIGGMIHKVKIQKEVNSQPLVSILKPRKKAKI